MLRILDTTVLVLAQGVSPSDTALPVSSVDAAKLNALTVGDTAYLTLRDGTRMEQVLYTHNAAMTITAGTMSIPVVRAQLGTTAKSWPIKTCVKTELTEGVLKAMITAGVCAGCV